MMESINFRNGTSLSLLQMTKAALAQMPQKFDVPTRDRHINSSMRSQSLPRTVERNRDRWSVETNLIKIQPPVDPSLEVNPRQWLLSGNPRLAKLITEAIGDRWQTHLEDLEQLAPLADNSLFQSRWQAVKQANKQVLVDAIYRSQGIEIDPNSLFDLQLQPIEGHQRQLLNILHIINLVDRIKQYPNNDILPRTFIFGELGKHQHTRIVTESGCDQLPQDNLWWGDRVESFAVDRSNRSIVALITSLAEILAADPDLSSKLQVVYVPESAGLTDRLYAAADLSEEIATAAIEDLDLGKLKASINGVVSIGSLGKTNYWLQQTVGEQNCFRFGLAIPEIALFKEYGYDPYNYYKYYPQIRKAIDYILAGHFTPDDPSIGRAIIDNLLGADEHMVMADYIFYAACQSQVSETYHRAATWTQMSILNVAGVR
jgi:glycogen phosphorylase